MISSFLSAFACKTTGADQVDAHAQPPLSDASESIISDATISSYNASNLLSRAERCDVKRGDLIDKHGRLSERAVELQTKAHATLEKMCEVRDSFASDIDILSAAVELDEKLDELDEKLSNLKAQFNATWASLEADLNHLSSKTDKKIAQMNDVTEKLHKLSLKQEILIAKASLATSYRKEKKLALEQQKSELMLLLISRFINKVAHELSPYIPKHPVIDGSEKEAV